MPERRGVGGWAKRVKADGRYRLPVTEQISHRDKRYSIRNTVNGWLHATVTDGSYACSEH